MLDVRSNLEPEPPNGKVRRRVMHPNVDQQRTRCLAENTAYPTAGFARHSRDEWPAHANRGGRPRAVDGAPREAEETEFKRMRAGHQDLSVGEN